MPRSKAWSGHSSLHPPPSRDGAGRSAFTFGAVLPTAFFTGQLSSVVDEEAGHAREFVGLDRHDVYEQFLVGEVRAGQFEGFGEVCLVQFNDCAACGAGSCGSQAGFQSCREWVFDELGRVQFDELVAVMTSRYLSPC